MAKVKKVFKDFLNKEKEQVGDKIFFLTSGYKLKERIFTSPYELLNFIVSDLGVNNIDILPSNDPEDEEYFIIVYGELQSARED